ncbi:MAG TPA: PAS domain-containing protein [Verrucomicrobiae bacterium]|nr:PAS domain-containing protein [Verrucomicrobiae bacterium]
MINALPPEVLVQLLDALPIRIFWKDRESRFLGCNQLFANDAGIADPAEFIGKSDYYFFEPQQANAFRDDDADVMTTGQPKLGIVERLTHINCSVRWLQTNKFPLRDSDGNIWGVIGMYQDITELKRFEEMRAA